MKKLAQLALLALPLVVACGGAQPPSAAPAEPRPSPAEPSPVVVTEPAPAPPAPNEKAKPGEPSREAVRDPPAVLGVLRGDGADPESEGLPFGGLGLRGVGPGGLGTGEGTIGLGSLGGRGSGSGSGYGVGPGVTSARPAVAGSLPKEVIRRQIRQKLPEIRRCYESALVKKPDLQGRVTVRFVIDKDGAVSSAERDGGDLPDDGVAACVVGVFSKLRFPKPEGGGEVRVKYPFDFRHRTKTP